MLGQSGLARKAVGSAELGKKELVQSRAQVPSTERKQALGTAHKLALDMENPVAQGLCGARCPGGS